MTRPADPHDVLGVPRDAGRAEITAAYRRLVRSLHPDRRTPDPERLAAVLAAYRELRARPDREHPAHDDRQRAQVAADRPPAEQRSAVSIPVRVHRPRDPDLRAGPVRHDPAG